MRPSSSLLLFPVILILAPRVFDILPFGHFGDQDDNVVEPDPMEDVEHPQTRDEDAEKRFESFVDDARCREDVDAFRRAAGDDAEGEKQKPRREPQQGKDGEQNGGESHAFGVSRHFCRLKNWVHDVVEQQNDTANPDRVCDPGSEDEDESDDVMNEHLPKVFPSFIGEMGKQV